MQAPLAPTKPPGVGTGGSHPFAMSSGKVLGLDILDCKMGIMLLAWRQKTGQMPFLCVRAHVCGCVYVHMCVCVCEC